MSMTAELPAGGGAPGSAQTLAGRASSDEHDLTEIVLTARKGEMIGFTVSVSVATALAGGTGILAIQAVNHGPSVIGGWLGATIAAGCLFFAKGAWHGFAALLRHMRDDQEIIDSLINRRVAKEGGETAGSGGTEKDPAVTVPHRGSVA